MVLADNYENVTAKNIASLCVSFLEAVQHSELIGTGTSPSIEQGCRGHPPESNLKFASAQQMFMIV